MDNRDSLIKAQRELIQMFDKWVLLIKAKKFPESVELVIQSNIKRLEIANIEKTLNSKLLN